MNFPFGRKAVESIPIEEPPRRRRTLGVVLGAGVARGWAHIGVLREFEAMGLKPDIVVGSSVGAVVGGCYAAGRLDGLEEWARSLTKRRVFGLADVSFSGGGLIGGERLRARLDSALGDTRIEDMPTRFAAVATEIGTGHEIWLSRGRVVDALRASYALPGVFEPVRLNSRWLFDGAIVNPIPVGVARALGAETVIAVTVMGEGAGYGASIPAGHEELAEEPDKPEAKPFSGGVLAGLRSGAAAALRRQWSADGPGAPGLAAVMTNAFNITQDRIMRARLAGDPPDALVTAKVGGVGLLEFHRADELIALGREAARKAAAELLDLTAA